MSGETEYPSTPAESIAPITAEQLLAKLKAMVADNLLSQAQIDFMQQDPDGFIRSLCPDPALHYAFEAAAQVMRAIVTGYFQSLLLKSTEGEKFDEGRLQRALLKAQIAGVEALEGALSEGATIEQKIRIVEMLKEE